MAAVKLNEKEFDVIVAKAVAKIPDEIQEHLNNIVIMVQKRPSRKTLQKMGIKSDGTLLGLFTGIPLTERSITTPPLFPDAIYLYQEPLESISSNLEELEEEIRVTVVHEIAHYLGMTEERLAELGYG